MEISVGFDYIKVEDIPQIVSGPLKKQILLIHLIQLTKE